MKRYFLSQPVYQAPAGLIDPDQGIIRGITVARVGLARGHNGRIDRTFLLQLVETASTRTQGIKARFGHPNMCSTALGTYLGRFHNYAYHADRVTADLHLDPAAKTSPHGNLFDYVIKMAQSNPDMFGASIVFESADFELSEEEIDGKKTEVNNFRLKELRATDIVDDPAATDGLFSSESLPAQATQWLDQNPDLTELIFSKPENLIEFLHNYLNHNPMNFSETIKSHFRKIFSLELPVPEPEPQPPVTERSLSEPDLQPEDGPRAQSRGPFSHFLQSFPQLGITQNEAGEYIFSDGESEPHTLQPEEITETLFTAIESLQEELQNAQQQITQLSDKLAAKPTLPKQVSDPQVSAHLQDPEKDQTGKQMLQSIPPELRYRLRHLNATKQNAPSTSHPD